MKFILPPLTLALFGLLAWWLIAIKPEPERRKFKPRQPVVEHMAAERKTLRVYVDAYGSVRPRTSTILLAETPGLIEAVAPFEDTNRSGPSASFRAGGFFEMGDMLVRIEDIDIRAAKANAEALLRTAELQLEQERALAEQAKSEWELERDWKDAPDLVKRLPQIRKAEADAKAAEARYAQANRNFERTRVRAPFRGRILETMADVGQRVGGGASPALAKVYALDIAEVDLSLSRSELRLLNFEEGANGTGTIPEVQILDEAGKPSHVGKLDRSEGTVDPRTRLTNVVASLKGAFADPFSQKAIDAPGSLSPGEFVEARIFGPEVGVFVIPRSAFREKDTLLVINEQNRIEPRKVTSIRQAKDVVWVKDGLQENDKVCLTPLDVISAKMKVKLASQPADFNSSKR